jgi:methylglyoxal synthase
MKIALAAHNTKQELIIRFCLAYRAVLSSHYLCSTGQTGKLIAENTGLDVHCYLGANGWQEICSRVSCDEIDLLFFFRNPIVEKSEDEDETTLLRLSDLHNVPVATNIATGEALIQALAHGDLDWRENAGPIRL